MRVFTASAAAAAVAIAGDNGVGGVGACVDDNVDGKAVLVLCTNFGEAGVTADGESESATGVAVASDASAGVASSCAGIIPA